MSAHSVLLRAVGFLALWLVLAGAHLADIPAAVVAVGLATWVSLRLSPPSARGISLAGLAGLLVRFPGQSLVAGIDVARRAFSPAVPLNVGTVGYTPRLPPGPARDAFTAYASLMPGTLPLPTEDGSAFLIHCLDRDQPAAAQLAEDEARFMRMLGSGHEAEHG